MGKNQQLETSQSEKKTAVLKSVLTNILTQLSSGLEKTKPKQLLEIFLILKGMKQQGVMTNEDIDIVKTCLKDFGESQAVARQTPSVKKSLKKLLSFFNMKINMT